MLIDWFTVGAQALNFVILVWLLKRFLYRPVLDAIDAREARIAKQIADAQELQSKALAERDALRHKNEAFESERAALLTKATQDAQAERRRLLDAASHAADALTAKRQAALANDAVRLQQALGERARHEVFAIARRALADLASATLEERIGEVFVERLHALDDTAKARIAQALRSPSAQAIVRSTFELPAAQRDAIQNAVDAAIGADVALQFETAPELVSGIELEAGGQKLAWSIAQYLGSMEAAVAPLLTPQTQVPAAAESVAAGSATKIK
jgi:F-type H+-transporting ATPase subunit b